jgi:porphobilinogen deaminase
MKRRLALGLQSCSVAAALAVAPPGPSIRRTHDMPDGAPAFEVRDARGELASRIECIANGWYEADAMAARMLGSTRLMAAVVEKDGRIEIADLGPAVFNCVVVPSPRSSRLDGAASEKS